MRLITVHILQVSPSTKAWKMSIRSWISTKRKTPRKSLRRRNLSCLMILQVVSVPSTLLQLNIKKTKIQHTWSNCLKTIAQVARAPTACQMVKEFWINGKCNWPVKKSSIRGPQRPTLLWNYSKSKILIRFGINTTLSKKDISIWTMVFQCLDNSWNQRHQRRRLRIKRTHTWKMYQLKSNQLSKR